MMHARLELDPYERRLRVAMRTSAGVSGVRSGLLLRIEYGDTVGLGEAAPLDAAELGAAREALVCVSAYKLDEGIARFLGRGASLEDAADLVRRVLGSAAPPSARCALEVAVLDLAARRAGVPLAAYLDAGSDLQVAVNALIVEENDDVVRARAADLAAQGFSTFKLKVGTSDDEARRVRALLDAATGSQSARFARTVTLRLDANRAWTLAEALSFLGALEGAPVDYIEEPLAGAAAEALARLRAASLFGIALDESVSDAGDVERYAAARACDVVVLKLQRVGGLSAALALASVARERGLRVVLTDSLETAVGRAATLHCAAACTREAVGLAGAFLMHEDGSGQDRPVVTLTGPGLGASVDA